MELFLGGDEGLTYDMVSSKYALYIQALEADESLACNCYGTDSVGEAAEEWGTTRGSADRGAGGVPGDRGRVRHGDGRRLGSGRAGRTGCVRPGAARTPPAVSVQLNGKAIVFPDAQPESRNDRTMVPFRAIAETLGAAVGCADGAVNSRSWRGGRMLSRPAEIRWRFRMRRAARCWRRSRSMPCPVREGGPYLRSGALFRGGVRPDRPVGRV